jgi:L-asparagine transporter-like permease
VCHVDSRIDPGVSLLGRIAIAGTFGTGLFLNSGFVLATAGPAGALIAYILVGSVAYALVLTTRSVVGGLTSSLEPSAQ